MSGLQPPTINTQDPGAHELEESSDDHFSSASEGGRSQHARNTSTDSLDSPVPVTRVERVDDKAAHGEVPGTPAYSLRTQDAVPDEVEIVPEGSRPRSATSSGGRSRAQSHLSGSEERPSTPGGTPVPKTVVDRVDDRPSYGEVDGTAAKEIRMADAAPDEVREAPEESKEALEGRSGSRGEADGEFEASGEVVGEDDGEKRQAWFKGMWEGQSEQAEANQEETKNAVQLDEDKNEDDEDFGDDFDDFAEGEGNDDFGDFDEAEDAIVEEQHAPPQPQHTAPDTLAGLPALNLSNLTPTDLKETTSTHLSAIFPTTETAQTPHQLSSDSPPTSLFQNPRSLSLWHQLLSPPPMAPPNWTRSRIRRLFLVSLGVPVDLDEILPPSKQKRLILPNINLPAREAPTTATINPPSDPASSSKASTEKTKSRPNSPAKPSSSSRSKGPPPPPPFNSNTASLLCSTTPEALANYTTPELRSHVSRLQELTAEAEVVGAYWEGRCREALEEKTALEGVVENLIGFVKGRREGGGGGGGRESGVGVGGRGR
ncbi:hypothetical protein MBLNU230_g7679t1 [Neophaeotheca triangularis]